MIMKVIELLLELTDRLNIQGDYGAWIDSNTGRIYKVEPFKHEDAIRKIFLYNEIKVPQGMINIYKFAFNHGFVKIEHENSESMDVEGNPDALSKASKIINVAINQPEMKTVIIGKVYPTSNNKDKFFKLPEQLKQAQAYVRG